VCAWPATSFANDVWPIFNVGNAMNPSCISCHDGANPAQNLDLAPASTAYMALVGQPSTEASCSSINLVEPGSPANSYLVRKVQNVDICQGTKMPKVGTPLSTAEIDKIRAWIGNGAPNN
jgi:hypothetical protein